MENSSLTHASMLNCYTIFLKQIIPCRVYMCANIGSMLQQFSPVSLGATIIEQDPYLTYFDDQWTPTANGQDMK